MHQRKRIYGIRTTCRTKNSPTHHLFRSESQKKQKTIGTTPQKIQVSPAKRTQRSSTILCLHITTWERDRRVVDRMDRWKMWQANDSQTLGAEQGHRYPAVTRGERTRPGENPQEVRWVKHVLVKDITTLRNQTSHSQHITTMTLFDSLKSETNRSKRRKEGKIHINTRFFLSFSLLSCSQRLNYCFYHYKNLDSIWCLYLILSCVCCYCCWTDTAKFQAPIASECYSDNTSSSSKLEKD